METLVSQGSGTSVSLPLGPITLRGCVWNGPNSSRKICLIALPGYRPVPARSGRRGETVVSSSCFSGGSPLVRTVPRCSGHDNRARSSAVTIAEARCWSVPRWEAATNSTTPSSSPERTQCRTDSPTTTAARSRRDAPPTTSTGRLMTVLTTIHRDSVSWKCNNHLECLLAIFCVIVYYYPRILRAEVTTA